MWAGHVTNGAAAGTLELGGGGGQNYTTLDFDQTTQEYASCPLIWKGSNQVAAEILWTCSAATGPARWQVYFTTFAAGDDLSVIGGSAGSVTSSIGTADTLQRASVGVPLPTLPSGAIGGKFATVTLTRNTAHVADTLAGDARFLGMYLTFK